MLDIRSNFISFIALFKIVYLILYVVLHEMLFISDKINTEIQKKIQIFSFKSIVSGELRVKSETDTYRK